MADAAEQLPSENSGVTAADGPPEGRRFQPGQSGNPGGRPKGLAKAVRDEVGDEATWVRVMAIIVFDPTEKATDRIAAWKALSERGWGKPPQFAPIEDADPLELSDREADEIAASFDARLDELAAKRDAKAKKA